MEIIVVSSPDPVDTPLGQSPATAAGPGPEPDGAALQPEQLDWSAESAASNARISTLEEALEAATFRADSFRRGRRLWLGTLALLIVVAAILQAILSDHSARTSGPATSKPADPLRRLMLLPSRTGPEPWAAPPSSGELAFAAEKLGTALAVHPEQAWPQILNHIRETSGHSVCPFVWIDGAIALILPEAPAGIGSLPAVLGRCADAIGHAQESTSSPH